MARMGLVGGMWRAAIAMMVAAWLTPAAIAQTGGDTFFMVFRGRVGAGSAIAPRDGDLLVARVGNQQFQTTIDASGQYSGLTLTRQANDPAPVTFQVVRGSARYALVQFAGDTTPISVPYNGATNPLTAAFNAQTVNGVIGPLVSGGGGGGGGGGGDPTEPEGDGRDVDGNGMIELADAELVMRFIIGERSGVDARTRDANRDGRVSTDDVVLILRHVGEEADQPEGGEQTGGT